jgi:hypothetical protein
MIRHIAKYGNHDKKFNTDTDVERFFKSNGCNYEELVERCRSVNERVPLIENIIDSTWEFSGKIKVPSIDLYTGKEESVIEGPGSVALIAYWQLFGNSVKYFNDCLKSASFGDFQACVSIGIASIEAYIMHMVSIYNKQASTKELLVDTKEKKVPFHIKIDEWIPKMTGEQKLDKNTKNWSNFSKLKKIRNDLAIHPKNTNFVITYNELCKWLNLFSSGIAGLLVDVHKLFNTRIPSIIIHYAYLPDIVLIEEDKK